MAAMGSSLVPCWALEREAQNQCEGNRGAQLGARARSNSETRMRSWALERLNWKEASQLQAKESRAANELKTAVELRKVTDDVKAVYYGEWQLQENYC